jgi:hypothetical protein
MLPKVALVQGLYYLATGPKTDLWLVKTVGILVAVIGAVLLSASRSRRISDEIMDAAAELCLVALWAIGRARA